MHKSWGISIDHFLHDCGFACNNWCIFLCHFFCLGNLAPQFRPFTNMSLPAMFQLAWGCPAGTSHWCIYPKWALVTSAPHLRVLPLWMMTPSALCWYEHLPFPCKLSLISIVVKSKKAQVVTSRATWWCFTREDGLIVLVGFWIQIFQVG